jgi:hypothetical protein
MTFGGAGPEPAPFEWFVRFVVHFFFGTQAHRGLIR